MSRRPTTPSNNFSQSYTAPVWAVGFALEQTLRDATLAVFSFLILKRLQHNSFVQNFTFSKIFVKTLSNYFTKIFLILNWSELMNLICVVVRFWFGKVLKYHRQVDVVLINVVL
jgi:hypothetical protein